MKLFLKNIFIFTLLCLTIFIYGKSMLKTKNKSKTHSKLKSKNKNRVIDNDEFENRYREMEEQVFQELRDENRHRNKKIFYEYNNNEAEQFSKDVNIYNNLKKPDTYNTELNDFRME